MSNPYLTLKDMTGGTGCTPRTVRYYERQGLLRATRSAGGHRLFEAVELERLDFIISLREAGWTLEEVEILLGVREDGPSDHEAARNLDAMLSSHIQRLERKIALLSKLRNDLQGTYDLMQICGQCSSDGAPTGCGTCEQLPPLQTLPSGFRLVWRARGLKARADRALFDDAAALSEVGAERVAEVGASRVSTDLSEEH